MTNPPFESGDCRGYFVIIQDDAVIVRLNSLIMRLPRQHICRRHQQASEEAALVIRSLLSPYTAKEASQAPG